MAKRCTIVSSQPTVNVPGPSSTQVTVTNWNVCVLCQEHSEESLICPANSTRQTYGSGYDTLSANLSAFNELGCVPLNINVSGLDEGNGIKETLISHMASWHKSCFNKFSTLKLQRAQKRKSLDDAEDISPVKTRSVQGVAHPKSTNVKVCFFCGTFEGNMHKASTTDIDRKVRWYATELQDTKLLAKLAMGDMHAIDAVYHNTCLVKLYNRFRQAQNYSSADTNQQSLEGIALAELISYIEETKSTHGVVHLFKLSHLVDLYKSRLQQLNAYVPEKINSTRLKERILFQMPDLKAHHQGRDILLGFDEDIGAALQFACENSFDDEAIILAKAARIVRREMLGKTQHFDGSFGPDCAQHSVPDSLLALVNMILGGPNIVDQTGQETNRSSAATSIAQLLVFNSVKQTRTGSTQLRHNTDRETPLPIYIGLVVHAHSRQRRLVEKLYRLGLSISYDRVMQISSDIGNSVCALYESEDVVCPPKLKRNLFTTGCVDNIDHNPSSRTATDSFHGTAISLTQHPSSNSTGTSRDLVVINENIVKTKKLAELPQCYTDIQPITIRNKDPQVPQTNSPMKAPTDSLHDAKTKEMEWLINMEKILDKDQLDKTDAVSWSSFHASCQPDITRPIANTALLPLFHEQAHSAAMIMHSMKVIKSAIQHVNPGQTPIIAMDQPLYALAKQIQWEMPDLYGEDKFVVMMGGLHIEMAALKMLGKWLEDSGWTSALVQANITTSGKADAMLTASHVTRTRYAHQVTAGALYILQSNAYTAYTNNDINENGSHDFQTWRDEQSSSHPQFNFWDRVLQLELTVLQYICSLRQGNFSLYVQIVGQLIPWFFAMDQCNYARWVPIHIRDMLALPLKHPNIYQQFQEGKFVVQKSNHLFSLIALDHNHEQQNDLIKGEGGAVGLTEDPAALRRWMISGPEIARLVTDFETTFMKTSSEDTRHHEQIPGVQRSFAKDVNALVATIEEMGNPFLEDSKDLLVLDNKDIMTEDVINSVKNAHDIGKKQYDQYINQVLKECSAPITDTIHRNNLPLFRTPSRKGRSKVQQQVSTLKNDCNLFSRLYISCQSRDGNLENFFKHENQASPPSLSSGGKLRAGQKSDLLQCLERDVTNHSPEVDAKIFDGAVIVNMLPPGKCKTFEDYARNVFIAYIVSQASFVQRIDIVWDRYFQNSLKQSTRELRGDGVRRRVVSHGTLPGNWQSFLRRDENKSELFWQNIRKLWLQKANNL